MLYVRWEAGGREWVDRLYEALHTKWPTFLACPSDCLPPPTPRGR
jgi:hypothetical protein